MANEYGGKNLAAILVISREAAEIFAACHDHFGKWVVFVMGEMPLEL
jgi:hypothetical protein